MIGNMFEFAGRIVGKVVSIILLFFIRRETIERFVLKYIQEKSGTVVVKDKESCFRCRLNLKGTKTRQGLDVMGAFYPLCNQCLKQWEQRPRPWDSSKEEDKNDYLRVRNTHKFFPLG